MVWRDQIYKHIEKLNVKIILKTTTHVNCVEFSYYEGGWGVGQATVNPEQLRRLFLSSNLYVYVGAIQMISQTRRPYDEELNPNHPKSFVICENAKREGARIPY